MLRRTRSRVFDRAARLVERLVDGVEPLMRPLLTNMIAGGQSVSALRPRRDSPAGAFTVVDEDRPHVWFDLNLNVPRAGRGTQVGPGRTARQPRRRVRGT
ncbi:hypothetical protein [Nonomuraea sp. NPDC050643]|uniref:hypothetical protein n=1 Tax=Nonomuraea sp. NPDC050643 TaxID=3155660 RepID=UPI0033D9FCD5